MTIKTDVTVTVELWILIARFNQISSFDASLEKFVKMQLVSLVLRLHQLPSMTLLQLGFAILVSTPV